MCLKLDKKYHISKKDFETNWFPVNRKMDKCITATKFQICQRSISREVFEYAK